MELTEYTIYKHRNKEYLRFENMERNIFGFKKSVMRFIPRKHLYDENGDKIRKWKMKMFPTEITSYNEDLLVCGNSNERENFIKKFPHIQLYMNSLNTFIKIY